MLDCIFNAYFILDCDNRMLDASSGFIESPGYPSYYDNNLFCVWKLIVPRGKTLTIEPIDFDLEIRNNQETCVDFFVLVNPFGYATVSVIFLCGQTTMYSILSYNLANECHLFFVIQTTRFQ